MTKIEQDFQKRQSELLPEGKLQWQYGAPRARIIQNEPTAISIHETNRLAELQRKFNLKGLQVAGMPEDQAQGGRQYHAVGTTYRNRPLKLYYTVRK